MKRMRKFCSVWLMLWMLAAVSACGDVSSTSGENQNGIYIVPGHKKEIESTMDSTIVSSVSAQTERISEQKEPPATAAEVEHPAVEQDITPVIPVESEVPQTAEPPAKHTVAAIESVQTDSHTITAISVTSPVSPNQTARLTAQVLPDTVYSITVYYSSGKSKAKGLEDKASDSGGSIAWEWKVGQRTKAGTYRIVISGGGDTVETTFTVTE